MTDNVNDAGNIGESISNEMTDNVKTVITFPSSNKKIRSGNMKLLGYELLHQAIFFIRLLSKLSRN